jgi:diguanylate cyclase (GGDEF)-like protein
VVVLRDVTELNRQRRELASANERLVCQVETIERLRHDLAEQASRDSLTGLHNRRHVSANLGPMIDAAEEAERAGAPGRRLGVLMIDLDHFKSVNDRFGHAVGDAVLIALSETLAALVPPGALAARWGGEEFLVVLPDADEEAAHGFAETLRRTMGERVVTIGEHELSCTMSIGVVSASGAGASVDDLLIAADQALYAAKAAGRNRVVSAGTGTPLGAEA